MFTKLGIGSLLVGFFLGVFSGISSFMANETMWSNLTISKVLGEERTESIITGTEIIALQDFLDMFMYEVPVFVIFLGLGVLFLVIGMFSQNH